MSQGYEFAQNEVKQKPWLAGISDPLPSLENRMSLLTSAATKFGVRSRRGRWPRAIRFMESLHGFATAHLDHERWGETPSSPDLPATGIS